MKIAILSTFYPLRGGIAQFNASLYSELSKEHDVKAFTFSRQYPSILFPGKTQYVTPDDEAVPLESEALLDTANPFTYLTALKKIRKWDPDILILRYWMSWFGPSLGFISRHIGDKCKVISIVDNVIPHEPHFFDKPITKYFLSGSDAFVTMSKAVDDVLVRFEDKKPHIILDHPLYTHFGEKMERNLAEEALGLEHGKKNILFFGLIRKYKGLDILIDAFKGLDESHQLIIAGEPYGSFDEYQEKIDASGVSDRIKVFPKYISDSQVKAYFSATDVTVLPYRSATQSGISSISYHFEVPMIVTAVGGLKETIGDRGTGIVAETVSPECIREEIVRFFADPGIKEGCITKIRDEKDRLSWKRFAKGILDLAEKI